MNQRKVDIMAELAQLKSDLGDGMGVSAIGDWKIAKYQEYILAGLEPPYDIAELHTARQQARDRVNKLEAELETIPEEDNF